jgi:small subunit ribosomal protein S16
MALKIRLARGGAKKRPFYRIVVAEASSPRDGRFVEKVGTYNPLLPHGHAERIVLNTDRIKYWLSVGALATDRVELFLHNAGLAEKPKRAPDPKKSAPKKAAQERAKAELDRAQAAKEAAEAAKNAPKEEPAPAPAAAEEAPAAEAPEAEAPAVSEPEVPAETPAEVPAPTEEPAPSTPDEVPTPSEDEASKAD